MEEIKIRIADYKKDKRDINSIRYAVFVKEQKVPPELEIDDLDRIAIHILFYVDNKPVGTGRIVKEDGHIGRIAVLKEYRGKHIGYQMMLFLIEKAREFGLRSVWLSSQITAVGFYKKLGFVEYGNTFYDAGIKHINMKKHLL